MLEHERKNGWAHEIIPEKCGARNDFCSHKFQPSSRPTELQVPGVVKQSKSHPDFGQEGLCENVNFRFELVRVVKKALHHPEQDEKEKWYELRKKDISPPAQSIRRLNR